ncbi:ubiquitin-like autophagy protein Apg12-domain-containing protein [Talaromyces proteolyticus]|uniref:Ubiquitin-like protein ATG12 n=1 Tax=Talaromyces proteolyticus TaxID=1131652 RepID=A0AAD4Q5S7_9EURO|nr:ubiquitin-like autophagy protein Apg12-domain-containing protein [Talaromyces proteolyticus]KAH8704921.1 ubiquitin-like autophagy protein Apg12-domain-containing protein [Talaromyces proteolyticus]
MEQTSSSDGSHRNSPQPAATPQAQRPKAGGARVSSGDAAAGNNAAPIPDEDHGVDLPMTMAASVVLTALPQDAYRALADAEAVDIGKVTVRFQPLPSAPILRKAVFKISASQKFETVVNFLRKKLDCQETDSVFCYINNVFAPSLDEGIGGLWRCFKNETDDQLWVQYSMTPFFG